MAWRPLGRLGKKSVPPSQARATDAEALARIAASVACVIAPKSPDGRDYSVPDLVSHLVTELRQLRDQKRERNALEQEKATLEGTIQPSQAESQTQQAEWRNQEAQYRSEINGLRDTHERPRQGYEQVKKSEPHLATAHSQLQQRFQDLEKERTELKQAKVTLERKIQASQEESQTQRAEWRNQEVQYRSEINGLRDTHERLRQGYEQVKKSESHLATAHSQLQQRFQDLEKERTVLKQAKVTLEGTIQASQEESQTQEAKLRNQEVQYHSEISGLKGKEERLRQDYESYISKIRMQHANHETALEQSYKLEERRMREEHESAVRKLKDQVQGLHVHAENRENDFNLEKMQLEEAHRVKQDELKEHFKAHESQLKQAHKQQQERLQKDIQSRTKALIARENYSSITDGELKSMFSGLVREVDALARLKWTSNRSPWSDELLSQISDTTKRLQKHILKDTIWEILFEHVFCSPFRVFGKEGSVLESQWNKAFGKDPKTGNDHYTWPEPSFDAERWRYDTMRQGQEALKIDTSEYDPRNKLRKGFQSSMKIICEKLSGKFEMVSKIDGKTEQTMEEIAEKAAKICVAFGTQRCRIFVVTKDLKTTDEVKEGPDRQGKLVELLTQPELRRIGDGDGQSLDKEQTVAGCEGEIKKILY